jgi:dephospho-CoA kinase
VPGQAFENPGLLPPRTSLVHPVGARDGLLWQEKQSRSQAPFTLKEAALLFESGTAALLDKIIVVKAPEKVRIQRVVDRDKVSEEEVRKRMRQQMPEEEKVARADFVIDNSGEQLLLPQVVSLYQRIKALDHAG